MRAALFRQAASPPSAGGQWRLSGDGIEPHHQIPPWTRHFWEKVASFPLPHKWTLLPNNVLFRLWASLPGAAKIWGAGRVGAFPQGRFKSTRGGEDISECRT